MGWAQGNNGTTEDVNRKLLLTTDNEGMTAWHLATCDGNLDILQQWEWV
jgi:phage-related minor tail protein